MFHKIVNQYPSLRTLIFYLKKRILFKLKWLHNISCCSLLFHFWLSLLEHAWISHIQEQNINLCKGCPWRQYCNKSLKKNLNNVFLVRLRFWYNVTVKTLFKSSSLVVYVVFLTCGWSQSYVEPIIFGTRLFCLQVSQWKSFAFCWACGPNVLWELQWFLDQTVC